MSGVCVILPSYNRPNYLAEALASCRAADQIIIADDGSDFDVLAVARSVGVDAELEQNEPITVAQRLRENRPPRLYNRALRRVTQPIVTYLCDDDVFAPDWIPAVKEAYADGNGFPHMIRGQWNILGTDQDSFEGNTEWCLTTGNFAYRLTCVTDEQCYWNESTVAVHDALMLNDYVNRHSFQRGGFNVPKLDMIAGWRRVHSMNMVNFAKSVHEYKDEAASALAGGWLEGD